MQHIQFTNNPFLFVLIANWVFIPKKKNAANHCQSHLRFDAHVEASYAAT